MSKAPGVTIIGPQEVPGYRLPWLPALCRHLAQRTVSTPACTHHRLSQHTQEVLELVSDDVSTTGSCLTRTRKRRPLHRPPPSPRSEAGQLAAKTMWKFAALASKGLQPQLAKASRAKPYPVASTPEQIWAREGARPPPPMIGLPRQGKRRTRGWRLWIR